MGASSGSRCRRRAVIIGGAAAAWPLAARGQQPEQMRRIGMLLNMREDDPEFQVRITAFRQGLLALGWSESQRTATYVDRILDGVIEVIDD
jgi:hypothetical protein